MGKTSISALGAALMLALPVPSAAATDILFGANMLAITVDLPPHQLGDLTLLSQPVGQFTIAESASLNVLETHEASWQPLFWSARVTFSLTSIVGDEVAVVIQNNWPIDADSASFAGLLGLNIAVGTPVDSWTITSLSPGAYEADPDPTDGDDTQLLYDGVRFEFALLSLDTALYSTLDYQPMPLGALDNPNFGAFVIEEADALGNTLFFAYGRIEVMNVVPEPSRWALLAAGLALLGAAARRVRRDGS